MTQDRGPPSSEISRVRAGLDCAIVSDLGGSTRTLYYVRRGLSGPGGSIHDRGSGDRSQRRRLGGETHCLGDPRRCVGGQLLSDQIRGDGVRDRCRGPSGAVRIRVVRKVGRDGLKSNHGRRCDLHCARDCFGLDRSGRPNSDLRGPRRRPRQRCSRWHPSRSSRRSRPTRRPRVRPSSCRRQTGRRSPRPATPWPGSLRWMAARPHPRLSRIVVGEMQAEEGDGSSQRCRGGEQWPASPWPGRW